MTTTISLDTLRQNLLFHGTAQKITGELHGGGYDGVLWTAEQSTVAQNYIPECGLTTYLHSPMSYELNETIRPDREWYGLAQQMGYEADTTYDNFNRLQSWIWKGNNRPFLRDIISYLEKTLGYQKDYRNLYPVKTKLVVGKTVYLPSDFKNQGELYIFEGKDRLRIYDYTESRESDLNRPDYNKLSLFRQVEAAGYDAIKIHDFAQSKNWGNFGHQSIGLFPSGIKKLSVKVIPATNWDWNENGSDVHEKDSPEFLKWALQQ